MALLTGLHPNFKDVYCLFDIPNISSNKIFYDTIHVNQSRPQHSEHYLPGIQNRQLVDYTFYTVYHETFPSRSILEISLNYQSLHDVQALHLLPHTPF